jgi:predicted nucleic acid-binding protein
MHLIDTSAWIEYLRATDSSADAEVARLIEANEPIATTEPVIMELLAGARDAGNFRRLTTIRSMADCLIAAVGMRRDATVVHFDADFDVIASCVPLRTLSLL